MLNQILLTVYNKLFLLYVQVCKCLLILQRKAQQYLL